MAARKNPTDQWPRNGSLGRPLRERFFEKIARVDNPDACWEWIGGKYPNGYGQLYYNGSPRYPHRISWMLHHGYYPSRGQLVCHTCDNRSCVNPAHLYLGTNSSNQRDRYSRGANPQSPRRRLVNGKWQWITLPQSQKQEGAK